MIGSVPPDKGISPYVADLATELARLPDIELDVLAFRSMYPRRLYPGGDPVDRHARAAGIPGVRTRRVLRWWNPLGWLLAGLTLRGDVVHAQWWSYPLAPVYVVLLALARARGKRVVITLHNVEPHERGLLRRLANRAVLPFAHVIIVHSEANGTALAGASRARARVEVVPLGIRAPIGLAPGRRAAARASLSVPADARLALFAGNIRPHKGVELLLDAFAQLAPTLPAARLAVVGQPWTGGGDAVSARVAALGLSGRIDLRLEYVPSDELVRWFDAADVAVFPYTSFEAQSAAAGSALARGRAIIVSDVGGLPALVRDQRMIVPPGDAARLAGALRLVLSDAALQSRLEQDAEATAHTFALPQVAAATAAVYRATMPEPWRAASVPTATGERA